MITAGIDLAAQPTRTGVVILEWTSDGPVLREAFAGASDDDLLECFRSVHQRGGKVGLDCPLGWPQLFTEFVMAHAEHRGLPTDEADTRRLRLRATDNDVWERTGTTPLSVSTNLLAIPAFRSARLLATLAAEGLPVSRVGDELVNEVYPAASRRIWNLGKDRNAADVADRIGLIGEQESLQNEHVFDALIAALAARAVALGHTTGPPPALNSIAREEGWIRLPDPLLPMESLRYPTGHNSGP